MFKIGDKVRITHFFHGRKCVGFSVGGVYKIRNIPTTNYTIGDGNRSYVKLEEELNLGYYNGGFYLSELELYEKKLLREYGISKFCKENYV
jgi:hypothetical protein